MKAKGGSEWRPGTWGCRVASVGLQACALIGPQARGGSERRAGTESHPYSLMRMSLRKVRLERHGNDGRGVGVMVAGVLAARGVRYTSENVANALNWCGAPHAPLTSLPYGPRWVAQRQSVRKDTTYKVSGSSNDVELKVEAERGTLIIGEHTWKPNWSA